MGGLLSRPHDRWPDIFSHSFWTRYPYFLPCAAASMYGVASLIVASIFLKEVGVRSRISGVSVELTGTLPLGPLQTLSRNTPESGNRPDEPNSDIFPDVEHNDECPNGFSSIPDDQPEPPPGTLLTTPVLRTIAAYGTLAFLEMCNWVFLPLVYTTPIQLGGLGLDPTRMGVCLAMWGILRGILQLTVFHHILNFLGLRCTLI